MGLQFEGALDNISEPQLAFIRDVLEKRGYKDTKVTFLAVGGAGDNYVANVKRIIVRDGNDEFRVIAKIAPQNEFLRGNMNTHRLFRNEQIMYDLVLPKFQQLEIQADLPQQDRLRFPQCYGCNLIAPDEVILLEDMIVPGFTMLDRFTPLSDECIKSVLRNFALLHSLSYVLKHKELDVFNEFKSGLYNMWGGMMDAPQMPENLGMMENMAMMLIEGDQRKRVLKGSVVNGLTLGVKLAKQDEGSKHSVIQQGDSWTNNILFRFDGDALQESVLIDYQVSKEANPTCDLMYMILNCTDHKSRLENFYNWIDYYHAELDKALANHGLKANYVYPKDQLDADLKRYAKVMFAVTIILAYSLTMDNDDAAKMKEAIKAPMDTHNIPELFQANNKTNEILKKRLEGLIDTLLKFGLL